MSSSALASRRRRAGSCWRSTAGSATSASSSASGRAWPPRTPEDGPAGSAAEDGAGRVGGRAGSRAPVRERRDSAEQILIQRSQQRGGAGAVLGDQIALETLEEHDGLARVLRPRERGGGGGRTREGQPPCPHPQRGRR